MLSSHREADAEALVTLLRLQLGAAPGWGRAVKLHLDRRGLRVDRRGLRADRRGLRADRRGLRADRRGLRTDRRARVSGVSEPVSEPVSGGEHIPPLPGSLGRGWRPSVPSPGRRQRTRPVSSAV